MAVVFDEIVGSVDPEQLPPPEEQTHAAPHDQPEPEALRRYLRRAEQLAKRLRAD